MSLKSERHLAWPLALAGVGTRKECKGASRQMPVVAAVVVGSGGGGGGGGGGNRDGGLGAKDKGVNRACEGRVRAEGSSARGRGFLCQRCIEMEAKSRRGGVGAELGDGVVERSQTRGRLHARLPDHGGLLRVR